MKHNVDNYGCPLCHTRHFLSDRRLEGFPVPKELKWNKIKPFLESYRSRSIMKSIIADKRLSEYCTAQEGEHVNLIVT